MDKQAHMSFAEFGRFLGQYGAGMSRQAVQKSHVIPKEMIGGKPMVPVAKGLRALAQAGRINLDQVSDEAPPVSAAPITGRPRMAGGENAGNGYYDEKARTERVVRELKELELAERKGELVRIEDVTDALASAGRRIGDHLDQLAGLAGELTSLALSGGETAVRQHLRDTVRALRGSMTDALTNAVSDEGGDDDEG